MTQSASLPNIQVPKALQIQRVMDAINSLDVTRLGSWSDRGSRAWLGTESEEDVLRRMAEHEEASMKECMRLQELLTACVPVFCFKLRSGRHTGVTWTVHAKDQMYEHIDVH
jgi:hypothetical protein